MFGRTLLVMAFTSVVMLDVVVGKPVPAEKKVEPKKELAFKPIEINGDLNVKDAKDAKLDAPSKRYTVRLQKDKSYIIDLASGDFDSYLRLLDKAGDQLAEDDDEGGDLNARIIYSPAKTEDHQIVVTTFDGQVGKFNLRVREFTLNGEAKPRAIAKDGLTINDQIQAGNTTAFGKLGKTFSIEMKAGVTYTIDLESSDVDSYLYLFDSKSKLLAQDDDSGGDLNSRITFRAVRDGVHHIVATSLDGSETGGFTLKVRKSE
ncbi:MAG: hypothetical protein EXS16_02565 [Gemmataceae bacterium]|nr:hypothetical protein [Gemmataceae bacterium]